MELVEVLDNPPVKGGADIDIRLTKSQLNKIAGINGGTTRKRRKSKVSKAKPKKKKSRRRTSKDVDGIQVGVGAASAAALEVLVMRNKQINQRIPPQLRRYSGAAIALVGWMLANMKKAKKGQRSFGFGLFAGGLTIAVKDEIVIRQAESNLEAEMEKFGEQLKETLKTMGTEGLGYAHRYPGVPRMSAGQAAAALGMQSRVPYHPYGLGVFDYSENPGMGTLVDASHAPMDPTNDPRLDPGGLGLGELVDSGEAGAWLNGQFAFSDSDYRTDSW